MTISDKNRRRRATGSPRPALKKAHRRSLHGSSRQKTPRRRPNLLSSRRWKTPRNGLQTTARPDATRYCKTSHCNVGPRTRRAVVSTCSPGPKARSITHGVWRNLCGLPPAEGACVRTIKVSRGKKIDEAKGIRKGTAKSAGRAVRAASLGQAQRPAYSGDLRRTRRRRKRGHNQSDHRAGQSPRVPGGCAAGAVRSREG